MMNLKFITDHKRGSLELVGAIFLVACTLSAYRAHEARQRANVIIATAQTDIKTERAVIQSTAQRASIEVQARDKKVAALNTPALAIAAIPDLTGLPVHSRPSPGDAFVPAVELAQFAGKCDDNATLLQACASEREADSKIEADLNTELLAMKHKPNFWHVVKSNSMKIGISFAAGYAVAQVHK